MKVLIRADASFKIGTGHIMRDLVLAKRFSSDEVAFATRALRGNLDNLIQECGFVHYSLRDNTLKSLIKLLKAEQFDLLIIDHYSIDAAFERAVKITLPKLKIMALDDTYQKHHCDILLNHNIYAKKKHYEDLVAKSTLLLCGAKHTLLRDEFLETPKGAERDSILIAMGGSDPQDLSLKILKSLPKVLSLKINIITTNANKTLSKLQEYVQKTNNITLHIQTQEVAKLAYKAHFAIITPSGYANELYALKTPFLAIQTAKNQEYMTAFLRKNRYGVLEKFSKKEFELLFQSYLEKFSCRM